MNKLVGVILCSIVSLSGSAQKQIDDQFNSWITYSGNHILSNKWDIESLYSFRRNGFFEHWQQSLLRVGVGYKLTEKIKAQVGYDWVRTFPYGAEPISRMTDEHRIWAHLNLKFQENRFYFEQRLRFENRVIDQTNTDMSTNKFVWKYRLRFTFGMNIPLNHNQMINHTLFLSLSDEIFMNLNSQDKYFDQNWFYAGLGWRFNKSISVKIGYLDQFLPNSDGLHVENNHTFSVNYIQNLDFSGKNTADKK
ncbi:MAG: hypothetical protein ACJAUD_001811 [Crocinitomicaceae bacterium]|jgi:hypothetical protein